MTAIAASRLLLGDTVKHRTTGKELCVVHVETGRVWVAQGEGYKAPAHRRLRVTVWCADGHGYQPQQLTNV